MEKKARVEVLADAEAVARRASDAFFSSATEAIGERGRFTVVLSGGNTPRLCYSLIARDAGALPGGAEAWAKVHVFFGDERHVPPDHPDSNYRMANETLLSKVPLPVGNVHRIMGEEADASRAAVAYEKSLLELPGPPAVAAPRFDLVLLGMGADGHTASLFPGSDVLGETDHLTAAPWIEKLGSYRITLTAPALSASRLVMFLVAGGEKAETLRCVIEDDPPGDRFPCRLIRPASGELVWLVDRSAARLLRG